MDRAARDEFEIRSPPGCWCSCESTPPEHLAYRRELLSGLSGRVLDLGAGDGANFAHFPSTVDEVAAVEPEPYLRERARRNARSAPVPVSVVDALADDLPFEDSCFDAAVVALVLCSVADQAAALNELRRVIRPGGELRLFEHVLADNPRLARVQRLLERSGCWPLLAGGCHPARDTAAAVAGAGFEIERCRRLSVEALPARGAGRSPHPRRCTSPELTGPPRQKRLAAASGQAPGCDRA